MRNLQCFCCVANDVQACIILKENKWVCAYFPESLAPEGGAPKTGISKEAAAVSEEEENASLGGRRPIGLNSCSRMRCQQCLPQSLTHYTYLQY